MRAAHPAWRPAVVAVLLLVSLATLAPAQSGLNLERPGHWKARYDDGTTGEERRFVVMRPGWHVFAGPGGLFWDPGSYASGNYAVSSSIFLFPEGDPEQSGSTRLDSSFGLFVAADGLEGAAPGYLAFEIRNDGQFRIAGYSAGKKNDLVSWTGHDAVETLSADATGPLKNVLGVDVRGDRAVFYVNDIQVAELPADRLPLDGAIGLRAGTGLSLHITEIDIGPNRREE